MLLTSSAGPKLCDPPIAAAEPPHESQGPRVPRSQSRCLLSTQSRCLQSTHNRYFLSAHNRCLLSTHSRCLLSRQSTCLVFIQTIIVANHFYTKWILVAPFCMIIGGDGSIWISRAVSDRFRYRFFLDLGTPWKQRGIKIQDFCGSRFPKGVFFRKPIFRRGGRGRSCGPCEIELFIKGSPC